MDLIRDVVSTPYAFPAGVVVLVISCAILVFVFGFKSAEEPPFDQLSFSNDDRKPAGKKRKLKDKVHGPPISQFSPNYCCRS